MAQVPPGFPYIFGPPPSWHPPPAPRPYRTPPSRTSRDEGSSQGGIIAGLVIGFIASLFLFAIVCSICKGQRSSRARARTVAAAAAAAATVPRPWPTIEQSRDDDDDDERQRRRDSTVARLPAFTYSPSVKHNVTGAGEEAATCSVCLGAFQLEETVRLLPVCLHLYHVECIDPWLDAHSTCPLCRSDTDPAMDVPGRLPPV
ncbi:RING-H2 finger protein ATL43 [Brachypodium distachyon]|uniref:RING-type E3 ubiquitin transferase n=1 Tax=Brachypodium distachyon TaxID=15368 RepID=I1HJS5_BRADI|nr:RING-H2 finger protein ATL43 [Brachypodium distachyon]KQK06445.1 hypothetical protein BRADI_2g26390v3 [Brachypodium distachyon]|eukprot:XP_010233239.1 RING-H2 finger protein ATL43 [Brachypodium distachyon]